MTPAHTQLAAVATALQQVRDGVVRPGDFSEATRQHTALLAALPPRYAEVLHDLLNRLESSALFTDESCSFSQQDLLGNLQLWLDKATQQLQTPTP